jgi:hypothetical protein
MASVYAFLSLHVFAPGVGVAQSVQCLTTEWTTGVRSPSETKDLSFSFFVQAHPASYSVGNGGPFPGGKVRLGRDAIHPPPSSAEVRNE